MNNGGYYSPSGFLLRRRMREGGQTTGHTAVDRAPAGAPGAFSVPGHQPSAAMSGEMAAGATSAPPRRPFVPYIPNENTGITGRATQPFPSNPIMEYLQQMLLNMRPR